MVHRATNALRRRTYVDLAGPVEQIALADFRAHPLVNFLDSSRGVPITSAMVVQSATDDSRVVDSRMIVGQSRFFSDRLVTTFGYRTDKVKKAPKSWADLWNVKDFPGRRSLRKYPFDTIEEALMADGVPNNKVYPCDFDRAFKSLDKIKKDVAIWWDQGAQASQMLKTNEVDILPCWNGRIQAVIDEGAPVAMEWNQNIAGYEGWTILKGTPRADWCRKFIAFAAEAKSQAGWVEHLAYGPTNPNAFKFIKPERARLVGTFPAYQSQALLIDNAFWGKEKDKAIDMFNAWMLKG